MTDTVLLNEENNIATITLNRPDQLNSMNLELLESLAERLKEVKESSSQVVVLTGAGKAFSAGGDVKMMLQSSDPKDFEKVMSLIKEVITTFYQLPKITISALNGATAGLGLSLALASDYVIAQQDAKIAMNFIGIGLIPDGGGHFFMEQRVGTVKAKHMIWEGQMIQGEQALKLGLVDHIVEGELDKTVNQYTSKLTNSPLLAMIETKNIYANQNISKLEAILEAETKGQLKMRQSKDHQEGVQAFLDKRNPVFKGE
ncbi:enoyl-CoA hydratase [Halalkalibacillus sediminis]|uniref:Enoyl-CoA hydratase n=1 Tax=Halalkalibacillus sediminis TaxID=2018042 RepID=A0A2I0QRT1_9BACI|nr:enoyl-CoA hydratase [Halalkalibacillus sediminis]PKR77047.1 enoyl-CoA hydratase [Halalkalibacillus sediminis]